MKSQFELYDVKLNKNNALAFVRDVKDEQVIEPVSLKKDFGEKLANKLHGLRSDANFSSGNLFKEMNGLLDGVITKDSDGYGHVDWSTVEVDEMKPVSTIDKLYKKTEFVKADLKKPSVYGDFATGNVRESKAGDKAILVLSQIDDLAGATVLADGREALKQNSVLPVADNTIDLSYESRDALVEAVAKHEFGEDFNQIDEFNQVLTNYSDGFWELGEDSSEIHEVDGSLIDAANDIKDFSKKNNMSVAEFFQNRTAGTNESVDFIVDFHKYLLDNAVDRDVTPCYISNVSFDKKIPVVFNVKGVEQSITGFDDMAVDDESVQKYASEMQKVGFGNNSKSPYDTFHVLLEKEPKDIEEQTKKFFDDIDMEF